MADKHTRVPIRLEERARIRAFRDIHAGKRCFIIGNGPSLNEHDLSLLDGEFTFGANAIFLKTRETGFAPYFYIVEDSAVAADNQFSIIDYDDPAYKFFASEYKKLFPATRNTYFLDVDLGFYRQSHPFGGHPRFSRDASDVVFAGQTVTYLSMQLAFFMGFSEIYLIGMDFHYEKPDSLIVKGNLWTSTEDDPNHFHPDYFGAGKTWKNPRLECVAKNYHHARRVFSIAGRTLANATIGGRLEIFPRVDYASLFEGKRRRKSAPAPVTDAMTN